MVVKEKRGRRRYIAFTVISPQNIGWQELSSEMNDRSASMSLHIPLIIQYEDNKGIVRCNHSEKDETIGLLRGLKGECGREFRIETLMTSGTLRTLREKYFSERK